MKHSLIHIIILSLAAYVSSCSDEELIPPAAGPKVEGYYFVLAGQNSGSRVSYIDDKTSMFETGDILGAFAPENSDEPTNVSYAVKAVTQAGELHQVLTPSDESTKLTTGLGKYIFYYPYDATTNTERLNSLDFTVRADQRKDEDFEASDILWDVLQPDADAQNAIIDMDHVMATIVVKIDKDSLDVNKGIDLLNVATEAKGVNRLACVELDDMINTNSYTTGEQNGTIKMHPEKFSAQNQTSMRDMLVYRAAVPAFQTLIKGQEILQVDLYNQDGSMSAKKFKLAGDLKLLPGHSYIFTLRSGIKPPVPEVGDDDSWVLDVLDPETGKPVGLLCREYLRYQPDLGNEGNMSKGYATGTIPQARDTRGMETRNINSQAWVFYNLQEDGMTPELSQGTVLRFVYDIIYEAATSGYNETRGVATWPLPHHKGSGIVRQIILSVKHGHNWIDATDGEGIYGTNSTEYENYYMHGGKITWDPVNNHIADFQMPEEKIDNVYAYDNAHIAIPKNGIPHVSYKKIGEETEKIGLIIPHNFIDKRLDSDKKTLLIKPYPIVKIGFNKFWMSKSLRASTTIDGTPLTCYNKKGEMGLTFNDAHIDNNILEPGYIFTFTEIPDENKNYDPYNDFSTTEREQHIIPPLYNYPAFEQGLLLPKSDESINEYAMPTKQDADRIMDYFGYVFPAKITNSGIRTKNRDNYAEPLYDALAAGKWTHQNCDLYTANISGFNLRAIGLKHDGASDLDVGGIASFLVLTDNRDKGISYVKFNSWNCWSADEFSGFYVGQGDNYGYEYPAGSWQREECISRLFSQVRFFMRYKNQADTRGLSSITSLAKGRSTHQFMIPEKKESRNVYVPLTE